MKILISGTAGFIGSALASYLLERGDEVVGIDNHNNYYDTSLKDARLSLLLNYKKYLHFKVDISDSVKITEIFKKYEPQIVVNLAAQAGVRYSIDNPKVYIDSNLLGFMNILENCKNINVEHLVYASSSSVYGGNTFIPFSVEQNVDHPLSLYAATKKSNELMAHVYSNLYNMPSTGLRFFTVYGPWDRPDMALQKFSRAIMNDEIIQVYNHGNHKRDFTYIDDVIEGIAKVLNTPATPNLKWSSDRPDPSSSPYPWRIYNLGNNKPVKLLDFIKTIEKNLGKEANKEFISIQAGDVPNTWANIDDFKRKFNFEPKISIDEGITKFVEWFINYYKY